MEIYVVRHGLTELNKKGKVNGQIDEPLAPEGFEQARDAVVLIPKTITHIYVSPLLRARQTAEIINEETRPIIVHPGLSEIHMGSLAGKAWTEMEDGLKLKQKHRSVQFDYSPYGGESASGIMTRVRIFLEEIHVKHGHHEVLLVTHGGIIRVIHLFQHGQPLVNEIEHISLLTFNLNKILK